MDSATSRIRKATDDAIKEAQEAFENVSVPRPLGTDATDTDMVHVPVTYLDTLLHRIITLQVQLSTAELRIQEKYRRLSESLQADSKRDTLESTSAAPSMIPVGRNKPDAE